MMLSLFRLIRFELVKAIHSKMAWMVVCAPALFAFCWVGVDQAVAGLTNADVEGFERSAYASFARGASNGYRLGCVLFLLYAAMAVASEGNWQTFKTVLLRPHHRLIWITAKFKILGLLAFAMLFSVALAAWAAGALAGDFADIAEEGYVIYEAAFLRRATFDALALLIPPLIALAGFGLFCSTLTDHTGVATSLCLGAYFVLETVKSSAVEARPYFFNTFAPSLFDISYFEVLRGFADGMSDAGWESPQFYFNVATPLVSAFVFFVLGAVVFSRRNVAV